MRANYLRLLTTNDGVYQYAVTYRWEGRGGVNGVRERERGCYYAKVPWGIVANEVGFRGDNYVCNLHLFV